MNMKCIPPVLLCCLLCGLLTVSSTAGERTVWQGEPVLVVPALDGHPVTLEWTANQSITYKHVRLSKQGVDDDNYWIMYIKEEASSVFQPVGWPSPDMVDPRFTVDWNGSLLTFTISELSEEDAGIFKAEIRSDDNHYETGKIVVYNTPGGQPPPRCFCPETGCNTDLSTKATFIFIIVLLVVICVVLFIAAYVFYTKASKRSRSYSLEEKISFSSPNGRRKDQDDRHNVTSNPEQCTDEQPSITSPLFPKSEDVETPPSRFGSHRLDSPENMGASNISVKDAEFVCRRTIPRSMSGDKDTHPSLDEFKSGLSTYYSFDEDDRPRIASADEVRPRFVSNVDVPEPLLRALRQQEIDKETAHAVLHSLNERVTSLEETFALRRMEFSKEGADNFVNSFVKDYKIDSAFNADLKECLDNKDFVFQVEMFPPGINIRPGQDTFTATYLIAASLSFGKQFLAVAEYTMRFKLLKQSSASQDELLKLTEGDIQQYLHYNAFNAFKKKGFISKINWAGGTDEKA